ncbi:hypothetical protein BH20ACT19_BH20ACT19_07730 [soil metagenome]
MRAADGLGGRLGEPKVADLARLHELGHRPDGVLDRRVLVDPVLVVEVDVVHAEALERGVARAAHVLGLAVDPEHRAVLGALVAELGGEHDLVPAALDRPADEALVGERPVHVGGVEERHPELERAADRGDRLVLVGRAVELGHAHAAEPLCGDLEPLASERALVHVVSASVGLVAVLLAAVLVALSARYGPHRDELYFVQAGANLAWAYPDQGVLTPLVTRLTSEIAPGSLIVLRLPAAVAAGATVVLAGLRDVRGRGGVRAEVVKPVSRRLGALLRAPRGRRDRAGAPTRASSRSAPRANRRGR